MCEGWAYSAPNPLRGEAPKGGRVGRFFPALPGRVARECAGRVDGLLQPIEHMNPLFKMMGDWLSNPNLPLSVNEIGAYYFNPRAHVSEGEKAISQRPCARVLVGS